MMTGQSTALKSIPSNLNLAKLMIYSPSTINKVTAGPIFASINISKKKTDDASGCVQQMTTSQQFEEANIQLETMQEIKVEKISNE